MWTEKARQVKQRTESKLSYQNKPVKNNRNMQCIFVCDLIHYSLHHDIQLCLKSVQIDKMIEEAATAYQKHNVPREKVTAESRNSCSVVLL